jgi:hypothetical protein
VTLLSRRESPRTSASPFGRVGITLVPLALALVLFGSSLVDDAYITLGEADRLARYGTLTNYNGDRIEQSSSILHVVTLAFLNAVTRIPLVWATTIIGLLFSALTVYATMRLASRIHTGTEVIAGLLAATSLPLVYWSLGGLETTMASFFLAMSVGAAATLVGRKRRRPAYVYIGSAAAYAWVRPEGALILTAGVALGLLTLRVRRRGGHERGVDRPTALLMLAAPIGALVVVTLFRLAYFSTILPQPAWAKQRGLQVQHGVVYVLTTFDRVSTIAYFVMGGIALVGAFVLLSRGSFAGILTATTASCLVLFVILTGGDWMQGGRFLATTVPLLAALASVPIARMHSHRAATLSLVALNCLGLLLFVHTDSDGTPAWASVRTPTLDYRARSSVSRSWPESRSRGVRRDLQTVPVMLDTIAALHAAGVERVTIGTGQNGVAMFYTFDRFKSGVRLIDRDSLATHDFDHCREIEHRGVYGTRIRYRDWFANAKKCGVEEPDLVFDLGVKERIAGLEGYETVYQQLGQVCVSPAIGDPRPKDNAEFIAIRRDIVATLNLRLGLQSTNTRC